VARASTGKEAFDYLQNSVPSLVLLDLNLPHYIADDDAAEGFGILSYIRSSVGSDIPVIVITRERSEATRSRAVSLGANNFFPKSLDIADLEQAVSGAMRERRMSAS
jgi:DNA-binding NarL/FixJ family response regulator